MAKKDAKVYIKRSKSTITDGSANLPQPSAMEYGELALNYHKGVEVITFKNDNNEMVKFEPVNIVQGTGSSTKDVMSQDAVTKELNKKANTTDIYNKGDVYTKSECDGKFLTINTAETNYLTKSEASSTYTTKSYADSTYATKSSIPTKVSQLTNDSGYQTSSQVDTAITSKGYITTTTADGKYQPKGDYLTKSEASSTYATITTVNGKQDNLVSGTNIKTINGESLLGSGNITIETGTGGIPDANKDGKTYGRNNGAWVEITSPDLSGYLTTTTAANTYLSKTDATNTYLSKNDASSTYLSKSDANTTYATKTELGTKQDTLVSGVNIKTINGNTILGNGNIEITTGTGGISDAPSDGLLYARKSGSWTSFSIPDVSNFLTRSEASSTYATISTVNGKADKASTLAGYGITDAYIKNGTIYLGGNSVSPLTTIPSNYVTDSELSSKGYLTSDDFKTINNQSIIGSGNIEITTGTGGISDAPTDGKLYGRKNANWESITIPTANRSDIDILNGFGGDSLWNNSQSTTCNVGGPLILKVTNNDGVTREINTDDTTVTIKGEGKLSASSNTTHSYCKESSTQFIHTQGVDITIPNATTSQEGFMSASDKTKLDNTVGQKDGLGEIFNSYDGGLKNSATTQYAHAEGVGTTASGSYSHAENYKAKATGDGSHAEGGGTTASGQYSHAEGESTTASGQYSHVEGASCQAIGDRSHAEGSKTIANNYAEHADGIWNVSNSGSGDTDYANNTIHSVGIGQSDSSRFNAFEIMRNGDIYIYGLGGYDGTNYKSAMTLANAIGGSNNMSSLGTLPLDKKYIFVNISSNGSIGFNGAPPKGSEFVVIVTSADGSQHTITGQLATLGLVTRYLNGSSPYPITVPSNGFAEIRFISDGEKLYVSKM